MIKSSQQQGVSARRSCAILVIEHRRIVRWQQRTRQGLSLANLTPWPQRTVAPGLNRGDQPDCGAGQTSGIRGSVASHPGGHRVGSRPLPGFLLHCLPRPQGAESDDRTRSWRRAQRSLQSAAPQRSDRAQPALVLGHQLSDDVPERRVSLPLPAARRVVPQARTISGSRSERDLLMRRRADWQPQTQSKIVSDVCEARPPGLTLSWFIAHQVGYRRPSTIPLSKWLVFICPSLVGFGAR